MNIKSSSLLEKISGNRLAWVHGVGVVALAAIVLVTFHPGLRMGFYLDDYVYLERAGRTEWSNALAQIFDPRLQTLWYRPLQAIQIFLEYQLVGGNANVYHVVNMTYHVINVVLLWLIVWRISKRWRLGFISAFLYATFSVYPSAINWIGIVDPLVSVLYLLTLWFWLDYIEKKKRVWYALAFASFVLALMSKQIAVTIPVVLFLIEWLLLGTPLAILKSIRRYAAFVLAAGAFSLIQYFTQSTHTFAGVFGWQLGTTMAWILLQYLVLFFFPYYSVMPSIDTNQVEVGSPILYAWVGVSLVVLGLIMWRKRSRVLLFLGAFALLNLFPVLPFPFIEHRYLYLPIMAMGVILGLFIEWAWKVIGSLRVVRSITAIMLACIAFGNGLSLNESALGSAEWARQLRVPFNDIARAHPTLPKNTLLYFIDPITPTTGGISGMSMVRYGKEVWVKNWGESAQFNRYDTAYVYYFGQDRRPREILVDQNAKTQISRDLPIDFEPGIRLTGYEIPQTTIKRGMPIVLVVYYQAMQTIERDYTMFVHVVDAKNQMLAQYDSAPRKGKLPTTEWLVQGLIADALVLPIDQVPAGSGYKIVVGWYDSATQQRVSIIDANGQRVADSFTIDSFAITE